MAARQGMDKHCAILLLYSAYLCVSFGNCNPLYPYADAEVYHATEDIRTVNLPFPVYFSGMTFQKATIMRYGAIQFSFNDSSTSSAFSETFTDNTAEHFLTPFFMNTETQPTDPARIYFRHITSRLDSFLADISQYIKSMTINNAGFMAKYAMLVTWENMTDYAEHYANNACRTQRLACRRNTFQAVLIASEDQTFVVFNYGRMELPASLETYKAGFNGGLRNGWSSVLESDKNEDIVHLNMFQGSDTMGRYIFEIGKDFVVRGGCRDSILAGRENNKLVVYPRHASILGGRVITVQGGCLQPDDIITCTFADIRRKGHYVSETKLKCITPMMTVIGDVDMTVTVSRLKNDIYIGSTIFVINMASREGFPLQLSTLKDGTIGWNETNPSLLGVQWNPGELTTNPSALVDIKLIGYRETAMDVIWQPIRVLGRSISNSDGSFTFTPSDNECSGNVCRDFEVGIVELSLQDTSHAWNYESIHTGALPLGWFVNSYMTGQYGSDWPVAKCKQWYKEDQQYTIWVNELLNCPCNLDQALADFGRWQEDPSCSIFHESVCKYHKGAVHCVRSVQPVDDAGNQCCYTADGLLRFSEDSYQGSTPDRCHSWGTQPYGHQYSVPELSHWVVDVVTFYYCCLWDDYRNCDLYMEARPTRDCSNYVPPKSAVAYGDPHIGTFDGLNYDFGGKGDFLLLKCNGYEIQGKFSQLTSIANSGQNATVLTSIAMRDDQHPTGKIEIRLRGSRMDTRNRLLDVIVNGQYKYFDITAMGWQDFSGVSIMYADSRSLHSNFTVIVKNGIGMQVAESNGLLHVICNVPPHCKDHTSGLFGTWDDTTANDFTTKNGDVIPTTASKMNIYQRFGISWNVSESSSLFKIFDPADYSFMPILTVDQAASGSSVPRSKVSNACGNNEACKFDYYVTGNEALGKATLSASVWHETIESHLSTVPSYPLLNVSYENASADNTSAMPRPPVAAKPQTLPPPQMNVPSCPLLNVPYSIKDNYNYSLGNVITVTGCRPGKELSGSTLKYACGVSSSGGFAWAPDVTAKCTDSDPDAASIGTIVGIVLGVLLPLIAIVVVVCVVIAIRRKNTRRRKQGGGENMKPADRPEVEENRFVATYKAAGSYGEEPEAPPARRLSTEVTV